MAQRRRRKVFQSVFERIARRHARIVAVAARETALSNMEAELSSHWPDVCYVYLTTVAARRPDDEESRRGGDGTA